MLMEVILKKKPSTGARANMYYFPNYFGNGDISRIAFCVRYFDCRAGTIFAVTLVSGRCKCAHQTDTSL